MSNIGRHALRLRDQIAAEQATGCPGAGNYAIWAEQQGYPYCEVVEWGSSAGDWTFIVSKNGFEWFQMDQVNNYPRPGFSRNIGDMPWYGTAEEAIRDLIEYWEASQ
jgi:hypothetical protein